MKTYDMIGRYINQKTMSCIRLRKFEEHKLLIKENGDPEKLPVVRKTFGNIRGMDLFPSHLCNRLGI